MIDNDRRARRAPGLGARAVALALAVCASLSFLPGCSGGGGGGDELAPTGGVDSDLVVAGNDLDASGPVGGPFFPPASYILSNQGTTTPLEYEIVSSSPGVRISDPIGTIDEGGSIAVTVDVDPTVADTLLPGVYLGTVTFRDRADSSSDVVRPASLTVEPVTTTGPILSEVVPPSGPPAGGNMVTVIGLNFEGAGATTLTFGGRRATNLAIVNDTRITCTIPAGTQGATVDLNITNGNGSYTLTRAYSYDSVLAVNNVEPERGPSAGGNTVTVVGTGFQNDGAGPNTVTFGGTPVTNIAVVDDRSLTCTVPSGTPETWVDVSVSNNHGSVTLSEGYRYRAEPALTDVTPTSGPAAGGNAVTLTGSRFQFGEPGPNTVLFGGAAAANVAVVNDQTLTCDAPFGTAGTSVDVIVSNINGTATLSNAYSYNTAPTLTGVAPTSGPANGGNTVTLIGTGFLDSSAGTNSVSFGGSQASNISVSSDSALVCDVPAGQGGTTVDVVVSNANGTATLQNGYTYDQVSGSLDPSSNFTASGPEGGPFMPDFKVYTIANTGATNLRWSVALSDTFVFVDGPTSGTLGSGQSAGITLRLASIADLLTPGNYTATASFSDLDLGQVVATRDVVLSVNSLVDGWTDFSPSPDTRMIYVSNSGSDSNDGLSSATPKRTIAAGRALLRDGYPDWLMLARGSSWNEAVSASWSLNGRSSTEKMVVQDYGNPSAPRPTITGVSNGVDFSSDGASHVAFVGLRFVNLTDDPAIDGHSPINDILIENCFLDGTNMSFQTPIGSQPPRDVQLRRNVIINSGPSGIFGNETQNMLVEECIFYNNGLSDDTRAHNIYLSGNNGPNAESGRGFDSRGNVVRGCILLQANGNLAIKWRAQFDGVIERNVFSRNRIGVDVHTKWANEYSTNNIVRENVIVDQGNPSNPAIARGIELGGAQDVLIEENIITSNPLTFGGGHAAFRIGMPQYDTNPDYQGLFFPSSENVTIQNNVVYGWNGNSLDFPSAQNMGTNGYRNIRVIDNEFQNVSPDTGLLRRLVSFSESARFGANGATFSGNRYWSMWAANEWFRTPGSLTYGQWVSASGETGSTQNRITYTDPDRDLVSYTSQLGLGSNFNAFVNAVIQQEKGNWDEDLAAVSIINYIRTGFDRPPLASP